MITPSFGLTATERVLPRLALDFTTASLNSRVTFTRTGATAARVNASGFPNEDYGYQPEIAYYRAGVKTGDFTSGTVDVTVAGNSGIDYTPTR